MQLIGTQSRNDAFSPNETSTGPVTTLSFTSLQVDTFIDKLSEIPNKMKTFEIPWQIGDQFNFTFYILVIVFVHCPAPKISSFLHSNNVGGRFDNFFIFFIAFGH